MSTTKTVVKISDALAGANGNRRTRTLSDETVAKWVIAIARGECTSKAIHGGHVANAYKYPAFATGVLIFTASSGEIMMLAREVGASKGTSGFGDVARQGKIINHELAESYAKAVTVHDAVALITGEVFLDAVPPEIVLEWYQEWLDARD